MLSATQIKEIAALLHLDETKFSAAVTVAEEQAVEIPKGILSFLPDELQTLKTNEYNTGKKAGVEMDVKSIKEELGLEFQGKTIKGLLEAANAKAVKDAGIDPGQKVTELTQKITTLTKTVQDQELALREKDKTVAAVKTRGELYKHIPAPGENGPALANDDVINLMEANGYSFAYNDAGALVASKAGQALNDKLGDPTPIADVVKGFMTEKKLISAEGGGAAGAAGAGAGRGGVGSGKAPVYGKLSEIIAAWKGEGKSTNGSDFQDAVMEHKKQNPELDLNA